MRDRRIGCLLLTEMKLARSRLRRRRPLNKCHYLRRFVLRIQESLQKTNKSFRINNLQGICRIRGLLDPEWIRSVIAAGEKVGGELVVSWW